MFIPRGKAIHENLATSYVLLDALVADLREGGFSGVVEVLLRGTDSFVVINRGLIAAVLEKCDPDANTPGNTGEHCVVRSGESVEQDLGPAGYTRTTLAKLAERARQERGRVSIYGYSAETAAALARRIAASSLYVGLSSDSTDLDNMIHKLVRERDREWFVDINTRGIPTALIHMRDGNCRILNAEDMAPEDSEAPDIVNNKALGRLLYECGQPGTKIDVYFSRAEAIAPEADGIDGEEPIPAFRPVDISALANGAQISSKPEGDQRQPSGSFVPYETQSNQGDWDLEPLDLIEQQSNHHEQIEKPYNVRAAAANHQSFEFTAEAVAPDEIVSSTDPGFDLIEPKALESFAKNEGTQRLDGADALTEVKRFMGEIARTIEEAAQSVDRPDSFSMALRAGQLKVADRYPFLDPFASEIEYLTGEIVFVGQATVEEFVAGLTEALTLAVQAVMKSTAYPERFRAYVTEDLQKLLARDRREWEGLGLDRVIEQIIHSQNVA